jgi:hypothetical protein
VVTVPDGWEGWQTDDTTVLALRTSDHRSNMSVKLTPGAEILTAQEAADAGAEALTQDPTIKAVIDAPGTEETTVDGESARGYTYTLPAGVGGRTAESRGRQMFVKHAGKIYTVSFSSQTDAFGTANADYEKVIASWKWSG